MAKLVTEEIAPKVHHTVASSESIVVSLPSKGIFYKDKKSSITISPFTVAQVERIYAASLLKSKYDSESTFISVIGDSILDFNIFDLTIHDFDYLKTYIRIFSYRKSPINLTWSYELDGQLKTVHSVINVTNLDVTEIEKHLKPIQGLSYTTVRDHLSLLQIEDESKLKIAEYASYLEGKDLDEKLEKFYKMNALIIIPDIKEYAVKMLHGVDEYVNLKDPEVSDATEIRVSLKLELINFFP